MLETQPPKTIVTCNEITHDDWKNDPGEMGLKCLHSVLVVSLIVHDSTKNYCMSLCQNILICQVMDWLVKKKMGIGVFMLGATMPESINFNQILRNV